MRNQIPLFKKNYSYKELMLNNAFSNFLLTRKNISYFRETKLEGQENLLDTLIQCIKAGFSNQTFILGGFKYHFTKIDCTKVRIMCITSQIYTSHASKLNEWYTLIFTTTTKTAMILFDRKGLLIVVFLWSLNTSVNLSHYFETFYFLYMYYWSKSYFKVSSN